MSKFHLIILIIILFVLYSCKNTSEIIELDSVNLDNIPTLATMISHIDPPCQPRDCFVQGKYCYIAGGFGGIVIIDISNPLNPFIIKQINLPGFIWKIKLFDNIAIVAQHNEGISIYELTSPVDFKFISSIKTKGEVYDFILKNNFLFLADGTNGFSVIDIHNIVSPKEVANIPTSDVVYDLAIGGNIAYIASGMEGVKIIDIQSPSSPSFLSNLSTRHLAIDITYNKGYLYIGVPGNGICVAAVKNPKKPVSLYYLPTQIIVNPLVNTVLSDNLMFCACLYGGLRIFDVSTPEFPKLIGKSNTDGPVGSDYARAFGVTVNGGYAYMSTFYAPRKYRGLQILKLSNDIITKQKIEDIKKESIYSSSINKSAFIPIDKKGIQITKIIDEISKASKTADIDLNNISFDIDKILGMKEYRLDGIRDIFSNPLSMLSSSKNLYSLYASNPKDLKFILNTVFNQYKSRHISEDSTANINNSQDGSTITEAISGFFSGNQLPSTTLEEIKKLNEMPDEIKTGLILILNATQNCIDARKESFIDLNDQDWEIINNATETLERDPFKLANLFSQKVKFDLLENTTIRMIESIDKGCEHIIECIAKKPSIELEFSLATPAGLIIITGTQENIHKKDAFLLIDLGGNDIYTNNAGGTFSMPAGIAINIDISGDDLYLSRGSFSQGCGIGGIGILYDKMGNDIYNDKKFRGEFSQGYAACGIGILYDESGNDEYNSCSYGQGAAFCGIGLLLDGQGSDTYLSYYTSQGFGSTLGLGCLIDFNGDDSYIAGNIYPDTIRPKFNYSNDCQGVGHGFRDIYNKSGNCINMSGGIGMLMDIEGNDTYNAGGFAQGSAYWDSMGLLIDGSGDDTYSAIEYAQGGCVHLAIAGQFDFGGNDSYSNKSSLNLGTGKDLSIGIHYSEGGNDSYKAYDYSMGMVMGLGLGLFIDTGGDDNYSMFSHKPGIANINAYGGTKKNKGHAFALFIDMNGNDSYNIKKENKTYKVDNTNWSQGEDSIGIDFEIK